MTYFDGFLHENVVVLVSKLAVVDFLLNLPLDCHHLFLVLELFSIEIYRFRKSVVLLE